VDNVWTQKKPKMNSRRLLRDHREGSKNTFTVGNGHHPGAIPGHGDSRETGSSRGCLAPAGGAWRRGSRATGGSGAAQPDKAPFISYMKGASLYSAGRRCSRLDRHAGQNANKSRAHWGRTGPAIRHPPQPVAAAGSGRQDQHFAADGDCGEHGRQPQLTCGASFTMAPPAGTGHTPPPT
jgi:hypothetical protein